MRRDFSESAPPIALPASRTRSPEASMGHLPGNPAEEPDSARSGGHLPGKSPWADAGGALRHRPGALGPSAGGRMRAFPAGFDDSDAVRASGGRSWPSQSEAGAARTQFPRRPHNGWRHRASALRRLPKGGIFHPLVRAGEIVSGGTFRAEIVSPMTGEVMEEISAPVGGVVFFTCNKPMVTEHALLFRIVPRGLANA